jgi:hypothetical protein
LASITTSDELLMVISNRKCNGFVYAKPNEKFATVLETGEGNIF